MTECRSPELQDLLPDYAADMLDSVASARVSEHLTTCAVCADDLVVLQMVRRARPQVAVPDIAAIVAALPPAPPLAGVALTGPRLVREEGANVIPATPPSMLRTRPRGVVFGLSVWRLAATLGVVIAGGASILVARRGVIHVQGPTETPVMAATETSPTVAMAPASIETLAVATPADAEAHAVSVSYGDLGDYSEAELESMLARLDQWDGATNTEPLPGVPILPNAGGGTP
jgi:hypothetical protein